MNIKDFYIFCCQQQQTTLSTVNYMMVSWAGTSTANGLYTLQSGDINGASSWVNTYNYQLFRGLNSAWFIGLNGPGGTGAAYTTTQTNLSLPLSGTWVVSSSGVSPVPVVDIAYSVLVSGAGSSQVNGLYTYAGVYNNLAYYTKPEDPLYEIYKTISSENGSWIIADPSNNLYETDLGGITPPYNLTNPWDAPFTPTFGDLPAPTVTPVPIT